MNGGPKGSEVKLNRGVKVGHVQSQLHSCHGALSLAEGLLRTNRLSPLDVSSRLRGAISESCGDPPLGKAQDAQQAHSNQAGGRYR